jgi:hypothetical protein
VDKKQVVDIPKITFGIIVVNGEPFTRYCLRSIYPYAHEIIVVEGGHEDATSVCTPDGHSTDGTLETLYHFKETEDPENKLTIVTRNGFWPKIDELGRCRTPQSRAYAEKATGDYLWQIDIDEFYKEEDMLSIINLLKTDPDLTAISFKQKSFWGDINYISESYALLRNVGGWHRIFKWGKNYSYQTHEPPTILDENGIDVREKKWLPGETMAEKGIFMYHYSLLFPWQVEQKVKIYQDEKPEICAEIIKWSEENYFRIDNPFRIHNIYKLPSWIEKYNGPHPSQVVMMMNDIKQGKVNARLRQTDDVESLLANPSFQIRRFIIKHYEPLDIILKKVVFNAKRVKNIPGKISRMLKPKTVSA